MYKLVIADDEYEIRTGLANYFPWETIGFQVAFMAKDGKEALDYITTNKVHVVLTDIRMPIMSGIDLAKEIYNRNIGVKIIFLSGHKEFEYAREALLYGVKDYIIKPTKYNEIMDIFSKLKDVLDKELTEKAASKQDVNGSDNYLSDNVIGRNDIIINNIKSYINENYKKATLEEIGKIVYMNPDYLSKFFKDKTGERFSDYLNAVRMKKAAEFLKDFSFKTYEVSEMVGYSNSHNFTRAFKKYYDIAPSEYRHSNNTNFKNTVNDDYR